MAWPYDQKQPVTLETIKAALDRVEAKLATPVAASSIGPDTPTGYPASNIYEALSNAGRALDIDGVPHRWSGPHPGSLEDSGKWCVQNNLQWPPIDFGPEQFGKPAYADWKDARLALVLLFQSDGLKTQKEHDALGLFATQYDEKVKLNGWANMTLDEWFKIQRSTNGQGGASGGGAN